MDVRKKVYLAFATLILMTLIAKLTGFFNIESISIPGIGLVSLVLSAGMMMLVMRGYQWARQILIIMLAVSSSMFLLAIFIATSDLWHSLILFLFFISHAYVAIMLRSREVRGFVDNQRQRYDGE